jgi:hypothetical protein
MQKTTKPKQTVAQKLGLVSRRVNGKLYPTAEQATALTEQAIAVRQVQNAVIWRVRKLTDEKYGPWAPDTPRTFCCQNMQNGTCPGGVQRDREVMQCDGTEKGCVRDQFPSQKEMGHWATAMIQHDARLQAMSTFAPRRAIDAVYMAYQHAFRRLKKGEEPGFPAPRHADRLWLPLIHIKRAGEIGASGSGCELIAAETDGPTSSKMCSRRSRNRANRHWQLRVQGIGLIKVRLAVPGERSAAFLEFSRGRFLDVDIEFRNGEWLLSVCMHAHVKRRKGERRIEVKFDGLECLARVNGEAVTPPGLLEAMDLEDLADAKQSARDMKWAQAHPQYSVELAAAVTQLPRRSKERKQAASRIAKLAAQAAKGDEEYVRITGEVAQLKRHAKRIRADALHKWTTAIVADAGTLHITDVKVSENSQTPHGDEKEWGAATEIVSEVNRTVRRYAPYTALMMLKYKAEEAGISAEVHADLTPEISIGEKLGATGKAIRKATRKIRREQP